LRRWTTAVEELSGGGYGLILVFSTNEDLLCNLGWNLGWNLGCALNIPPQKRLPSRNICKVLRDSKNRVGREL